MTDAEREQLREWVQRWQRVGPELDRIKREELRAPDYYEKNLPLLNDMLQWACDHARPRTTSGLVEQQRLFMKLREKQGK